MNLMLFNSIRPHRRSLITLLVMLLAVYIFVPQLKSFKNSSHFLSHPNIGLVILGFIFVLTTYLAGALTICLLSFRKLDYWTTVLVQLAASFINRLLPAGAGALGVNFLYLKQRRQTGPQAAAVMGINNLIGLVGHCLIVVLTLLLFSGHLKLQESPDARRIVFYVLAVVVAATLFIALVGWHKVSHRLQEVLLVVSSFGQRRDRLYKALGSSLLLSLANMMAFFLSARAVGAQVNLAQAIIVFTIGVSAGSATPTPGGIGGFEAGLTVGLIGFGVPNPVALAASLLFRLLSFWLPLVLGGVGFLVTSRSGWLSWPTKTTSEFH